MKDGKNRTHRQQSVALFIYLQIFQPIPILMKGQEAKPNSRRVMVLYERWNNNPSLTHGQTAPFRAYFLLSFIYILKLSFIYILNMKKLGAIYMFGVKSCQRLHHAAHSFWCITEENRIKKNLWINVLISFD